MLLKQYLEQFHNKLSILTLFCILLYSLITQSAFASPILSLDENRNTTQLTDYLSAIEDSEKQLTFEDILTPEVQSRFKQVKKNTLHRGYSKSSFWLRFKTTNNSNKVITKILKSKFSTTAFLDFYIPNESNNFIKQSSGFLLPYSKRQEKSKDLIFKVKFHPHLENTYYLRIDTETSTNLELQLLSEDSNNDSEIMRSYFIGGFYSILLALLIVNILIIIFFKKNVHFLLLTFIISLLLLFSIVDGIALPFLEGLPTQSPMVLIVLLSCISLSSLVYFCRTFSLKVYENKLVQITHNLIISTFILSCIVVLVFGYAATIPLYVTAGTLTPIFIFVVGFFSWKMKSNTSNSYLIGLFLLLAGIIVQTLFRLGFIESVPYIEQSARFGIILFLIFMSFTFVDFVQWLQLNEKHTLAALSRSRIETLSSEEKFSKSFYHLPEPMQIINYQDLTRVAVNNSYLDLIGYTEEEVMNKPIFENTIVVDPDSVKKELNNLITTGKILNYPLTLLHKNGSHIYTEASGVTLKIEDQSLALISFNDVTELRKRESALQEIAMGVSSNQNGDFFSNLILQLSKVFDADYAFLGLINKENPKLIDTYSFCKDGIISDNFSYELTDTPCENVVGREMCSYPKEVSKLFPKDEMLVDMGIESYIGTPLNDANGETFGIMVVLKTEPMESSENNKQILQIFASRAASEFENHFSESQLIKAQQKLKLHVQDTPLAVIEWNISFEVSAWNPAAEQIFGYSENEALGKKAKDLIIPKKFLPHVDQIWTDLLNQQGGTRSSNENITKQGNTIFCEWYNTPLITEEGEVIGVASLASDISSEHKAKTELISQEQHQRAILSSMIDGVLTMDDDGVILSCNESALRISGYTKDEIINTNITSLAPKSVTDQFPSKQAFSQYLFEKHNAEIIGPEVVGVRKDKTEFPMRLSIVKLLNPETDRLIYIGSFQDLTQLKRQEEQLRRSQKMDALGKLTGGIAHDFNNLLGVIIGYSDLLDKTIEGDSKQTRYSQQIHKAAERGALLTKKLLGFSRTKRTETTVVNINNILNSQIHLLEKTLTARIKLNFELTKNLWTTNLDEGDFEDAILNLCINASHAIEGTGQITIKTSNKNISNSEANVLQIDAGEYVLVQITDSGCGIDSNVIERIFDPFFSTKGDDGTGLGLSQVYGFVKNSKGAIKVYSELGHGTQFNMYFVNYDLSESTNIETASSEVTKLTGTETILVVDDEEPIRLMSEEILLQNGYQVETAETAEEALKMLKSKEFDLVLSDVIMPKIDGYQFAKIVQKDFPNVKIQLASGFTDDRQKNIKNELYYKQLLQKPYSAETLLITIRTLLDKD